MTEGYAVGSECQYCSPGQRDGEVRDDRWSQVHEIVLEAMDEAHGPDGTLANSETYADRLRTLLSGSGTPQGEGEDEWEPMSMSMAGVAHPRLIPFRHRLSGVVAWVDQRAAARLRGEGGGEW